MNIYSCVFHKSVKIRVFNKKLKIFQTLKHTAWETWTENSHPFLPFQYTASPRQKFHHRSQVPLPLPPPLPPPSPTLPSFLAGHLLGTVSATDPFRPCYYCEPKTNNFTTAAVVPPEPSPPLPDQLSELFIFLVLNSL